jgi:hypothetical protein
MSIKIQIKSKTFFDASPEKSTQQIETLQTSKSLENVKLTTEKARSKLGEFLSRIKTEAANRVLKSSLDRNIKNSTKASEAGYDDSDAMNYAKFKSIDRGVLSKGLEAGRAYLNAAAEVGAKSSLEFAKNDIAQTKENFVNRVGKATETYYAAESAFVNGQTKVGEFAQEELAKFGAEVQIRKDNIESSKKWLSTKGRSAWGAMKSMKDGLIQGSKDKIDSTKKSIGEKLILKGMELRGVDIKLADTISESSIDNQTTEDSSNTEGVVDKAESLNELSAIISKYKSNTIIKSSYKNILRINFDSPSARAEAYKSLTEIYNAGIVTPKDFQEIRSKINELLQ